MKATIVVGIFRFHLCAGALLLFPQSALACAACFGRSDSKMAEGMNMGIFSLLFVISTVLVGVAAFFVYLARRSAQAAHGPAPEPLPETTSHSAP